MEDTSKIGHDQMPSFKNDDKLGILHYENLSKSINQLSLSSSMITLNLIDCLAASTSNVSAGSCSSHLLDAENNDESNRKSDEKTLNPVNNQALTHEGDHEFKLKSPYGDWCAFE